MTPEPYAIMHYVAAFEAGLDDGFFKGNSHCPETDDELVRVFYVRGYDHGVWLYCTTIDKEEK